MAASRKAVAARLMTCRVPPAKDLAAGDAVIRTEAQPRGKVVLVLPARHLQADFADHGLGDPDVDAIDPGQVDAADAVQFTTQSNCGAWLPAFRRRLGPARRVS